MIRGQGWPFGGAVRDPGSAPHGHPAADQPGGPVGGADPALATCLAGSAALHRHLCPRQVLGARVGLLAGRLLGLELPRADKRLYVLVETDGCLADSVSVATGCWLGHRTLRLVDHGKTAAIFVDTGTGRAIRIWPHPAARRRALDHAPHARSRWHAQLEAYQVMPDAELLLAAPVTLELDLAAIRSRPGRRVVCAGCAEDVVNEREVLRDGVTLCRSCAGDRYYRPIDDQRNGPSVEAALRTAAMVKTASEA